MTNTQTLTVDVYFKDGRRLHIPYNCHLEDPFDALKRAYRAEDLFMVFEVSHVTFPEDLKLLSEVLARPWGDQPRREACRVCGDRIKYWPGKKLRDGWHWVSEMTDSELCLAGLDHEPIED